MQKRKKFVVYTKLDEDTLTRIDNLIEKKEFDNRSSFIRRAVNKYLNEIDKPILA